MLQSWKKLWCGHYCICPSITLYRTIAPLSVNTLRPRQNGRHFTDDILKCIFLNENIWILIQISLKFVPRGPNNNIAALVQVMACRWPGDKPLSEPMMDQWWLVYWCICASLGLNELNFNGWEIIHCTYLREISNSNSNTFDYRGPVTLLPFRWLTLNFQIFYVLKNMYL